MEPFIVDPTKYDKVDAARRATWYCDAFLTMNDIDHVDATLFEPNNEFKPPGSNPWHDKGWYWNKRIFVNLKKSRVPVKNPGFQWSYTGYKADMTAPGILAHETGHHVHFELEKRFNPVGIRHLIDAVRNSETAVSGYEPNVYEVFAEAMRLFIMNPELLAAGRPARFRLLNHTFGLKPPHTTPWRTVLQHAHPKLIAAAEKWIEK